MRNRAAWAETAAGTVRGAGRRLAAILLTVALGAWQVGPPLQAAEEKFDVAAEEVMVPMRDGVRLATDIYRPVRAGKPLEDRRPVVLIRTPYGKGNGQSSEGKYFASYGYVAVIQDTRGRYRSEGVWRWLTDDGPDGVDCCAWIAEQAWSSGRIGMIGCGSEKTLATRSPLSS